jgi:hypothetical protein
MMNIDAAAFRRQRLNGRVVVPAAVLRHRECGSGSGFDECSSIHNVSKKHSADYADDAD